METLKDNKAALEFLQRVYPEGPWVLTAIRLDRKAIETRTFYPSNQAELQAWLKTYNGERNIYWSVNPTIRAVSKKAEREDIKEVCLLHVDVDPRAGEDLEAEVKRILALQPSGAPPASFIIYSGGGAQFFWKLETPIPINGDLALAEDAKRFNQQLELLYGGDNCHDISRIMRLPGTTNLPDERKRKKGRTPQLARVVEFHEDRVYPIAQFTAAPAVQMPDVKGFSGGAHTVKISGNIERLEDINDLDKWGVPDRVKVILVQGKHPDEPKEGDNSRSMWVFDAVCQLVRKDVPDDVIFSILTDPDFGISESVLEKGNNAERYAIRQIERAKEEAVDPWLRKLNEEYAVIMNIGGKCRVVEEIMDHTLKRSRLTRISFDDFRNSLMHEQVDIGLDEKGNMKTMEVGKWWLKNRKRRQFKTVVFAPGHEVPGSYNMWKGFAVTAKPGDCSLFIDHVKRNVCSNDPAVYAYTMGWMARAVQEPDTPGEVAMVLRGGKGVGKSFFAKVLGSLFGRHFLHVSNPSHLVGNFNAHLRDVVLLFADEAFYAGDKKHASILKTLITEETIQIEAKGVDVESSPNYVHLIMASNDDHVVPASGDERRFLVLDVGAEEQQRSDYFKAISKQMDDGGREALLHLLLTYDLSDYEVRNVPQTDALKEQKELSLGPDQDWWFNKLKDGSVFPEDDGWLDEVRKEALVGDYIEHTKKWMVTRRGSETALGKFLLKHCPSMQVSQKMATFTEVDAQGYTTEVRKRAYFWSLPTLDQARQTWDELHGKFNWRPVQPRFKQSADGKPPF